MANATLFRGADMQRRLASSNPTVMTGLAIRISRSMGECGGQPGRRRFVAGIALRRREDMARWLAGRRPAVTIRATARRWRHQRAVIHPRGHPGRGFVALAAILGSRDVTRRLAGLCCSVMAGGAGLRQPGMRKGSWQPALGLVADTAILRRGDMGRRLHLRINHPSAVVTVSTGGGCTLENTLDVTALTGSIGMHPSQRKPGLVVIETDTGACALSRHQ